MLNELSTHMADAVDSVAASVVQVQGRRRPASGLVYADGIVLTTMRAIGRDDGLRVRRHDGTVLGAELAGWDPTTSLAVLRVADLGLAPVTAFKRHSSRGQSGSRRRPLMEQCRDRQRRHHLRDWRALADRQTSRDRSGDSHDRTDARRVFRWRVHRRKRRPDRYQHGNDHPRDDSGDSGRDRVGRSSTGARAWADASGVSWA